LFPSVIEAVSCAVAVQRGMIARNAGIPEETRITFRVGVNLGDVIVEDGDIHGDGVNIAARLEGIAEPGGISISEDAFRQVRGKVDAEFADIGEQSSKTSPDHCVYIVCCRKARRGREYKRCRSPTSPRSRACPSSI
jgi:adenylate cyclase